LAVEHDLPGAAMRAYNNMTAVLDHEGGFEEMGDLTERGLALARKVGHQGWEAKFLSGRVPLLAWTGWWNEAIQADAEAAQVPDASALAAMAMERANLAMVHAARGDFVLAEQYLFRDTLESSDDVQAEQTLGLAEAWIHFFAGRYEEALASARRSIATRDRTGLVGGVEASYALAGHAALELGEVNRASEILAEMEAVPPGSRSPHFRAEIARLSAKLATARGEPAKARARFEEAVALFRSIGWRFHLAMTLAEQGQWLEDEGKAEEARPLLAEARSIFEELRAKWWLERLDRPVSERSVAR
jgi:tetratricopeptide (TPR) repeat protein